MSVYSSATPTQLKKTALFDLHVELGAKMVGFAGYHMPVSYQSGIIKEHLHTRQYAGLFDISHMGQIRLNGKQAGTELEKLVPGNLHGLKNNRQRYTVFTNQQGGIMDDLIVARMDDDWMLVVNAACKQQDFDYLCQQLPDNCSPVLLENLALLALQGPMAAEILDSLLTEGSAAISFMATAQVVIAKIPCQISRCGYTGEDGYEISVANNQAQSLARLLLAQEHVQAIGLGARDTLRLEAGLCLYGHDIDTTTTPVEAGLSWVIDRNYLNSDGKKPGFPGAQKILAELESGSDRKRVGILPLGRALVREAVELFNQDIELVGSITSGGFGPAVGSPIAMGYVASEHSATDTQLIAQVRGRNLDVKVVALPFIPHRYYRSYQN
ncbi:MAG: glycine cleavage system aminomethyltransferase GcvT [Methylococcales bacterium]